MTKQFWGAIGINATLGALTLVAACGDGFGEGDCKATRTCEGGGGQPTTEGGSPGDDSHEGDAAAGHGATGGDGTTLGGGAGPGGEAGAFDGECRVAADCSNDDPADGEEVCNDGVCGAGNPPPTVVTVTPNNGSADIDVETKVTIVFSEALDAKTVTAGIHVLDGTTVVPGVLKYADKTVTFTPTSRLALLGLYTVSVTTEVTDEEGAPLLSEYTSEFSTRDGAWTTIDAAKGSFYALSDGLPISSKGDVLVAWAGSNGLNCPITARWFPKGGAATTNVFDLSPPSDCDYLSSSGNGVDIASVVWKIPGSEHGTYVEEYRDGAWQETPSLVSKDTNDHDLRVAVAPTGATTLFQHGTTWSQMWTTNPAGDWPARGDLVSETGALGPASVAYDADGNALALWHAREKPLSGNERIVVSRFDKATRKWSSASDLRGSVAADPLTTGYLRGSPVVAMDDKGGAMALWVDASASGKLMASRYSKATGWDAPESISGAPAVNLTTEAPALVFDGEGFAAAWTAQEGIEYYTFTARHDAAQGWSAPVRQQVTVAGEKSALKMPRLVSDHRGNSLLVFATAAASSYSLAYQRYGRGAWETLKSVPGGMIANKNFESSGSAVLALSINDSGMAALSWGNYDDDNRISVIRLSTFE